MDLRGRVGQLTEINETGLVGYLVAKTAAADSRRRPKDWCDIAHVLLHNDAGGVDAAASAVLASQLSTIRPPRPRPRSCRSRKG